MKQYNNRFHSSTKITLIEASLKQNERYVYQNLIDKRKIIKLKFKIHDHVRTANLRKTLSNSETRDCYNKLHEITEIVADTIPSYLFDNFIERYNETSLKKTKLSMRENKTVKKALNLS